MENGYAVVWVSASETEKIIEVAARTGSGGRWTSGRRSRPRVAGDCVHPKKGKILINNE